MTKNDSRQNIIADLAERIEQNARALFTKLGEETL